VWGERRDAYRGLAEKPAGERDHWQDTRRWEDNIKMDLQRVGRGMDWLDPDQDKEKFGKL
jgi:hypothetical protein